MHFEFLIEDQSGKRTLEIVIPKIIGDAHTFTIHSYKGIGHLPQGMNKGGDPSKRILLDQLPRLLRGYGKSYASIPHAVIVVCDLDDKCLKLFREELFGLLYSCDPQPNTIFCIAIEEGEAWLLGDLAAIKQAYPNAKEALLKKYENDAICGTWEKLADVVTTEGAKKLAEL